ncbi:hypothetical protein ISCGN_008008 [Ixodes scapularis]
MLTILVASVTLLIAVAHFLNPASARVRTTRDLPKPRRACYRYCLKVTCKFIDPKTCRGIVKPRASYCRCCPLCVQQLVLGVQPVDVDGRADGPSRGLSKKNS